MDGHKKLKQIRIAFSHNGEVIFDDVRMEEFMKRNEEALTLPVAILSIIGDPKSGKSFLLNVFLHYLKSEGGGGWITQFSKEGWRGEEGFHVSLDLNATKEDFESGIYMWPELLPWIDESDGIQKGSILLLDLEISQDEAEITNNELLECLCCFWSSMIVDNRKDQFKPNFLEILQDMNLFAQTDKNQIQRLLKRSTPPALCDHFIFVVRDFYSCGTGKPPSPEEHAERVITTESPQLDSIFKSLMEDKEKVSFFLLKNPEQIVSNGVLKMGTQFTNKMNSLTTGIFQRVEWKDIHHAEGDLVTFFGKGVEIVNLYNRSVNSGQLPDEDSEMLDLSREAEPEPTTSNTTINQEIVRQAAAFSEASKTANLYPSLPDSDSSTPGSPLKHGKITESEFLEQYENEDGFVFVTSTEIMPTTSQPQPQCNVSVQFPTPKPESSTLSPAPTMTHSEENGKSSQDQSVIDVSKQKETEDTCHHHHSPSTTSLSAASTCMNSHSKLQLVLETWQELKRKLDTQIQGEIVDLKNEHKAALERCPVSEIEETHGKQCPILIGKLEHYLNEIKSSVKDREDVNEDIISRQIEEGLKILKIDLELQKKMILSKLCKSPRAGNNSIPLPTTTTKLDADGGDRNRKEDGIDLEIVHQNDDHQKQSSSDCVNSPANIEEQTDPSRSQTGRDDHVSSDMEQGLKLEYEESMQKYFSTLFRQQLFVNETDPCMEKGHAESVAAVWNNHRGSYFSFLYANNPVVLKDTETLGNWIASRSYREKAYYWVREENLRRLRILEEMKAVVFGSNGLEKVVNHWIERMSDLSIRDMDKKNADYTITKSLQDFCVSYANSHPQDRIHDQLRTLLFNGIREDASFQNVLENLKLIETKIRHFRKETEKKLQMNVCLSPEKFHEYIEGQVWNSTMKISNFSEKKFSELLGGGLNKLVIQYKHWNDYIRQNEIGIANQLSPDAEKYYQDLMTDNMKGKFLAPDRLWKVHKTVVQAVLDGFKKSCEFKANEELDSKFSEFAKKLDHLFLNFETRNDMAGRKATAQANIFVHGQRKNYNTQMDDFLPKKGPSRSDQELEKKHKELLAEVCKLLTMEMANADIVIGSQSYETTLKEQIAMDWVEFKKLNKKIAVQEEREKNKKEAEKELEQKRSSSGTKEPMCSSSPSPSQKSNQTERSEIHPRSASTNTGNRVELPPIAIEFGCNLIQVGWKQDEKQIHIVQQVKPRIQITEEGDILIGGDVQDGRERTVDVWEIFMDMDIENDTSFYIRGKIHTLRHEVMLALFLNRVKKNIEETLNGRWTHVVMTVPLCFTSTQRRAIKDSTVLAGFSSCLLLNETSAAALYLANLELYKNDCDHYVAIGISGKEYYDFALYGYGRGQVEMIGSCGHRHSSLTTNQSAGTSTLRKVGTGLGKIITKLMMKHDENEDGKFREMMKKIIDPVKSSINVAIHIQHTKHKGINFGTGHGRLMPKMEGDLSVLYGAAIFASTIATGGEEFAKESIKDKVSYVFARTKSENESKKATKNLFNDVYASLKPCGLQETATLGIPSESSNCWVIREESSNFSSYIGCIKVAPCDAEINIKCHLSWDCIFDIARVHALRECQRVDFEWTTHNLNHSEIPELQELVRSLDKDEEKEALLNCKQQLQELVNHVDTVVSRDNNNLTFIAKKMFAKAIEEAKAHLEHSHTTMEMLTGKIELLEGLKTKYIK